MLFIDVCFVSVVLVAVGGDGDGEEAAEKFVVYDELLLGSLVGETILETSRLLWYGVY